MNNSLINWDPFRELDDMTERMNRLVSRSLSGTSSGLPGLPTTDIYEEDGKLTIETALPHFQDEEVDVQINQDRLEIKAEHKAKHEHKDRSYLRRESSQTSYYRQFLLPSDVDVDSAEAKFEDGMLKVSFERKELPRPKKLALTGGSRKQLNAKAHAGDKTDEDDK
jgi:HSP20 family protein